MIKKIKERSMKFWVRVSLILFSLLVVIGSLSIYIISIASASEYSEPHNINIPNVVGENSFTGLDELRNNGFYNVFYKSNNTEYNKKMTICDMVYSNKAADKTVNITLILDLNCEQ